MSHPFTLGVQYYRPPFPVDRFWDDDFRRVADSGLNSVQLWVLWSWVESTPGKFRFEDYDQLVQLADKHRLGVVLSAIAEVQPLWIHREVPGSEMIDHMGRTVISTNRCECHFGITPGGCTDHPGVWQRMQEFFRQVVTRYRGAPCLRGWDAWNELRWNVQADALVCHCPHTLKAFRDWLAARHGDLDGLNRAWMRRYSAWDEVTPGKLPDRPYTELMAWQHFLTARANQHGRMRYQLMKSLDPGHPVTVHGASPCVWTGGGAQDTALNRGNDWFYADDLDGVGTSSFPKWSNLDDADFGMRVECVKSAARDKRVWLSEVQGGRSSVGFNSYAPVDARSQQRWIWNGLACGADTILFWCWRDEVFGRESGGFGLVGDDGLAEERIDAMRVTGRLLREHETLLSEYRPLKPDVGVFFSPQTYYLHWAQETTARQAVQALQGYCRALVRKSIPYRLIEETHLADLEGLKILILPRILVTDAATEAALADFVRRGGTLLCESECGAFDSRGLYRYPAERFTAQLAGIREVGRRNLAAEVVDADLAGVALRLGVRQWLTPWQTGAGTALASHPDGNLIVEAPVGKGRLLLCGSYLGNAYMTQWSADFEQFVELAVRRAGWTPNVEVLSPAPDKDTFVYVKQGASRGRPLLFVFLPPSCDEARLRLKPGSFTRPVRDLISGQPVAVDCDAGGQLCAVVNRGWGIAVLGEA